jgi:glycosyltransferase involved in cell wall biosynthesis
MALPVVAKIMDKYPNVYFESMGAIGNKDLKLFNCFSESAKLRSDILPSTWTFKEYPKHLSTMKWDIGIAPLVDSAFTRCKSHIKFLEYSMYKIPTIASRVYPYYVNSYGREIIEHEKTGLLVKPKEWFDALEDLICNADKRKLLGENAHIHVKENWQYNDEFSDSIDKVIKSL